MGLQKYFKEFNKKIKMDYDVKSELKDKRDILLGILRGADDLPSFTEYNQGSYSMYLGVEPLDKEYDIDVGLRFHSNCSEYEPMDLKDKIYELLKDQTDYGATIKKPCVTVTYKRMGKQLIMSIWLCIHMRIKMTQAAKCFLPVVRVVNLMKHAGKNRILLDW